MSGVVAVNLLAVAVHTEQDVVLARQRARQIAALLGFELQAQTRIGTATSEIVRNAFRYTGGGRAEFQFVSEPRRCLVITVSDSGAGIPQLAEILAGKYRSTTGMGMGLLGTRRIMDRMDISAETGKGTTVRLGKFMPDSLPPVSSDALARITATLGRGLPGDAIAEVQQQNQELLSVLSELGQRQSELMAVNRDLEDANRGVVALNNELDAGAEVLRRTIEVKTRFLSNMTHEFRTPLNSIIALATMLEKLRAVVSDATGASDNVAAGSQQLSSGAEELSQGSTEQAAAEEASASMEEMAATSEELASQAEQLQDTIAYFRVDGGGEVRTQRSRAITVQRPAAKREPKFKLSGKSNGKAHGVKLVLESGSPADETDAGYVQY